MAEYESCILGFKMVIDMNVHELLVIGDSDLLIHQVQGEWVVKNPKITPYESRYTLLERICCALTWIAHKLRHYLSSYTTYLIFRMDRLKYIFQKATDRKVS